MDGGPPARRLPPWTAARHAGGGVRVNWNWPSGRTCRILSRVSHAAPSPPPDPDLEHLRLLSIFHYVVGGILALFSCFPILVLQRDSVRRKFAARAAEAR